jgi:hypothetical protein
MIYADLNPIGVSPSLEERIEPYVVLWDEMAPLHNAYGSTFRKFGDLHLDRYFYFYRDFNLDLDRDLYRN